MGEAQGDPPRHSVKAQHFTERPQACRTILNHSVLSFLYINVQPARSATGASLRRLSGPQFSYAKITFCGANLFIYRGQQFYGRVPLTRRYGRFALYIHVYNPSEAPGTQVRSEIPSSDCRNQFFAWDMLQKSAYSKTQMSKRLFRDAAPVAKRYAHP